MAFTHSTTELTLHEETGVSKTESDLFEGNPFYAADIKKVLEQAKKRPGGKTVTMVHHQCEV